MNLLSSLLIISSLLAPLHIGGQGPVNMSQERSVLMLTDENLKYATQVYPHLLVNFYTPWCDDCAEVMRDYMNLAENMHRGNTTLKLALVDVAKETKVCKWYGIEKCPSFVFFRQGFPVYYRGHTLSAKEAIEWALQKRKSPVRYLSTPQMVRDLLKSNKIAVIGFFKNTNSFRSQLFMAAAEELDSIAFGLVDDDEIMLRYLASNGDIVLYKPFDEKKHQIDSYANLDHLKRLIQLRAQPYIMKFAGGKDARVFRGPVQSFLLIFHKEPEFKEDGFKDLKHLAKVYHERMFFVAINGLQFERAMKFFDVHDEELPAVRIMHVDMQRITKYRPETAIDQGLPRTPISNFIERFFSGKLVPFRLAQPLPEEWYERPLKVLVQENFKILTQDKLRDVVVIFYSPGCDNSAALAKLFEQLADRFQGNDAVTIAKMDATANELADVPITRLPTIKLFRRGDNKVIDYIGKCRLPDIVQFIETGGRAGGSYSQWKSLANKDQAYIKRKEEMQIFKKH